MAILKNPGRNNFTVVDNYALRDENLSLKARGLLVTMLSMPDNWQFSESGLCSIFTKDGQSSIRNGLKELEECGYLTRKRTRDDFGRLSHVEWIIYDKPHLENPSVVNQPQLRTKELRTKESSTENTLSIERVQKKSAYGEFENVLLTDVERAKLDDKLGDICASEYIEKLSAYLAQTGRRYKSHYATVLNWWNKDGNPVKRTPKPVEVKPDRLRKITPDMSVDEIF